jgi:hypothetical protein
MPCAPDVAEAQRVLVRAALAQSVCPCSCAVDEVLAEWAAFNRWRARRGYAPALLSEWLDASGWVD